MDKVILTVLIPTVDRADSFSNALESVMRQISNLPVKVVVSDNASEQKEKLEYLQNLSHLHPSVTVLTRSNRLRPVEHFQKIIESVDSEYLLLLADDDLVGHNFIPEFFRSSIGKNFDVLKPRWVLSIDGIEKWDRKRNYLESNFLSLKLFGFFSSPDDALFYSIIRTNLLKQHIKSFPEHWSTTVERQPFWAYHIVLYLIINSRIRNTREAFSTWVNFEGNPKIESKEFEYSDVEPRETYISVLSDKNDGLKNSLLKLLEFQFHLYQVLISLKSFRWIPISNLGGIWFLTKRFANRFVTTLNP